MLGFIIYRLSLHRISVYQEDKNSPLIFLIDFSQPLLCFIQVIVLLWKKAGYLIDAIHELLKPDGLNLRQLFLENKQFHGQRLYRLGVHLSRKRHCKGHLSSHFWRRFFCYFALIFVSKKRTFVRAKKQNQTCMLWAYWEGSCENILLFCLHDCCA